MASFLNKSTRHLLSTLPLVLVLFVLLATPDWPDPPRPPLGSAVSALAAEPVAFDREGLGRDRAGALRILAGWALTSGDDRFGGISAIHVENGWVTAASDGGRSRAHGRRFYNFAGLDAFKAKFGPERWDGVYAVATGRGGELRALYAIAAAFTGGKPLRAIAGGLMYAIRQEAGKARGALASGPRNP